MKWRSSKANVNYNLQARDVSGMEGKAAGGEGQPATVGMSRWDSPVPSAHCAVLAHCAPQHRGS